MTPTDLYAYGVLEHTSRTASTPQEREHALRGMLLHRLQSGLAHDEILTRVLRARQADPATCRNCGGMRGHYSLQCTNKDT